MGWRTNQKRNAMLTDNAAQRKQFPTMAEC
jgi:hypothetical protein